MTDVRHVDLTDPSLHEPKGAAAAAADTVYVADGAGSGAFQKIESASIDATSIFTTNKEAFAVTYPDIGTAGSMYVPVPWACSLTRAYSSVQGAAGGSNTILTFFVNGGSVMDGTVTIASTAVAGENDTATMTTNNVFTAGQTLKITTDGGTSTTIAAVITLEFTRTA